MQIALKNLGFVNKIDYNSNMIQFKHKHTYVYGFEIQKKSPYTGWTKYEYTLLTDISDPQCKANRTELESMLRLAYGHLPKSVKFLYEKSK
jgi:hypothetical protein